MAYDASTGTVLWTRRYNGPPYDTDTAFVSEARAVAVSPDGSAVFVTGTSYSATARDYATVAYNASSGTTLWIDRYNGPGDSDDEAYALRAGPHGAKVFVTGKSYGSAGNLDYTTIAYSASSGTRSWVRRYDAASYTDVATTLDVSPNGSSVFVSGYSQTPSTSYDYATVAYRTGSGVQRWVTRYDDASNSDDQARSVGVSPDGSTVFVTGYTSTATTGSDYTTIAYDASTGAELWVTGYNGPDDDDDQPYALAVSPDSSSVFVTGYDFATATGSDYATLAYDASTGTQLWAKRYHGEDSASIDQARDVDVSPDGATVIVTGFSFRSATSNDYATLAYDASSGSKVWAKRYDGPAGRPDFANALDVSASAVFVTGYSYAASSSYFKYATVAYALT